MKEKPRSEGLHALGAAVGAEVGTAVGLAEGTKVGADDGGLKIVLLVVSCGSAHLTPT